MRDSLTEDEDGRLEMLFRPAAQPLADAGFSDEVMRRVARHVWRRRLLLAAAGAVGLIVAVQPAWQFAAMLGQQLVIFGSRWPDVAWLLETPVALAAGLLLMVGPGLLQWLEE
ncbi:MAG: hypothetical protein E4H19_03160 [Chromatiales bacterium]|jgi:hypothetical protein|nr:MAG: hypothetical protein E4H19_03160 [Chromatiales bacterium]